jgi:hypothetical protein
VVILRPTKLWRVAVWISFGLSRRYTHIWLYVHVYSTAICTKFDLLQTFQNVTTVYGGECLCLYKIIMMKHGRTLWMEEPPNCVSMPSVGLEHATRVTKSALDRMATNRSSVQWMQHVSYVPAATGEWRSTI